MDIHLHLSGRIEHIVTVREERKTLRCSIGPFETRKGFDIMPPTAITIADNQRFLLTLKGGVDIDGNPTPLAGPVTVTAADPTALLVSPGDDGAVPPVAVPNSFWIAAAQTAGHLGTFRVTATDSVSTLDVDVTVTISAEVGLVASVGTPQLIPAAVAPTPVPVPTPVPTPLPGTITPAG